jgi:uncharacterized protein involved in exopolysaccharide biosynthesis
MHAEQAYRELEGERIKFRIADGVRTVWNGRSFVIFVTFLGLLLGISFAWLVPPLYTSTTRLMPPDDQSGAAIAAAAASTAAAHGMGGFGDLASSLLGLKNSSDVFVGILDSHTVQDHIIEKFNLKHVYGFRYMADTRNKLASRVNIAIDRKDQMIAISVTDRSPQRAADMARAYVDELNHLVSELSTSSARRERLFLESRLKQVNGDLEAAEKEFSQFASKNTAIDIKEQGRAQLETAASLQGQLMVARSELEGLRQTYVDSHIRIRTLKARVAELEAQLQQFGGKDQGKTVGPETGAAALYPSIRKLPLLGVTYADLYRRSRVQETVYEVLTQEYELAKVQEAREIPVIKVLDPAEIPEKRSYPPRLAVVGIFTMSSTFLISIVFLFVSKKWTEGDPLDPGKVVITDIWVDLKQRRFLNRDNSFHPAESESRNSGSQRRFFTFLGLNQLTRNGNGPYPSPNSVATEEERCDSNSPESNAHV